MIEYFNSSIYMYLIFFHLFKIFSASRLKAFKDVIQLTPEILNNRTYLYQKFCAWRSFESAKL